MLLDPAFWELGRQRGIDFWPIDYIGVYLNLICSTDEKPSKEYKSLLKNLLSQQIDGVQMNVDAIIDFYPLINHAFPCAEEKNLDNWHSIIEMTLGIYSADLKRLGAAQSIFTHIDDTLKLDSSDIDGINLLELQAKERPAQVQQVIYSVLNVRNFASNIASIPWSEENILSPHINWGLINQVSPYLSLRMYTKSCILGNQ
ncbi:hypothetical protein HW132_34470 [Brasilonema sp. CT11]|nr:hypothetical protein [Brasilonema sp. CT11]